MVTGIIKLISLGTHTAILDHNDSLFAFLTKRQSIGIAVVFELLICGLFFFKLVSEHIIALLIFILSSIFISYRLARIIIHAPEPCACLGNITDWFPLISPKIFDYTLIGILIYLYFGSFIMLFYYFNSQSRNANHC
jgi:hypothetical protein